MNKKINIGYILITIMFFLFTFYEIKVYLTLEANLFGLFYLFCNFFNSFVLFTISYNYKKGERKIRVSKNIIVIVLGIFSSFLLTFLVPLLVSYVDKGYLFSDSVFLISKIFKPILYLGLVVLSVIELKLVKNKK